jgi:hypothetical protein
MRLRVSVCFGKGSVGSDWVRLSGKVPIADRGGGQ